MKKLSILIYSIILVWFGTSSNLLANTPPEKYIRPTVPSDVKAVRLPNYSLTSLKTIETLIPIRNDAIHKWGFFDVKGNKRIDFLWEVNNFQEPVFSGGYCSVFQSKRDNYNFITKTWYILDTLGVARKINITKIKDVTSFCDGRAIVVQNISGSSGLRYLYINGKGEQILQNITPRSVLYESEVRHRLHPFSEGLAAYYDFDKNLYGYVDKQGKIVIPAKYIDVQRFGDGLAAVRFSKTESQPEKWGYIDNTGKVVIPPTFTRTVTPFSEGVAAVEKANQDVVYINKNGEIVSSVYGNASQFLNGYAFVKISGEKGIIVIEKNFKPTGTSIDDFEFPSKSEYLGTFKELKTITISKYGTFFLNDPKYSTARYGYPSNGSFSLILENWEFSLLAMIGTEYALVKKNYEDRRYHLGVVDLNTFKFTFVIAPEQF